MDGTVTLPLDVLNLLLAAVLPMLTAVITARFANSSIKSLTLVLLTVISTALQTIFDDGGSFEVRPFLITTVMQFVLSVGLHFGLLKPISITGENGAIASSVPAGVGGPSDRPGPNE